MASILDPAIPLKISRMKERVCWQHPVFQEQQIDQTRLLLADGHASDPDFSFLVIGDSGSGPHPDHHPQRRIAEQMLPHLEDCRFLLHTGDVVYQVGSQEQYPENFIKPYREWLVGGSRPDRIAYDRMVFRHPFLPVPGNHDYYNLPWLYSAMVQLSKPLRQLLGMRLKPNVGWHGSNVGDAYARAFLDYLKGCTPEELKQHLMTRYTGITESGRCLVYRPGEYTRLPNRYYHFRYGGIDFFALDSSTFNAPSPLPSTRDGNAYRQLLETQRQIIEQEKQQVIAEAAHLRAGGEHTAERLDDLQAKLEQFEEMQLDIDKQLAATSMATVDVEQLTWLKQQLIASWHNPAVRGRIVFFHHPPYVTETTKASQGQTLAVRHHFRWVLDEAAEVLAAAGDRCLSQARPMVDLVICGHAHCFEYLRTVDTGHSDRSINWLVCGGSGLSLRRQQIQGAELHETFPDEVNGTGDVRLVAKSQLFVGLTGHKTERRRPYSFLRIDVKAGETPKFVVRPHISERYHQGWQNYTLDPLVL